MRLVDADRIKDRIPEIERENTAYNLRKVLDTAQEYIENLMIEYDEKKNDTSDEIDIAFEKLTTAKEMYDIIKSGYESNEVK